MERNSRNFNSEEAKMIALAIWDTTTGNGRDPRTWSWSEEDWEAHMENCHAAVASAWRENLTQQELYEAALARITGPNVG